MGKLKNKVAIVTGGTSGMGAGIARLFAKEGASIILSGRNKERGQSVVQEIKKEGGKAEFVEGDVSRFDDNLLLVHQACKTYGGVDILVPNAGTLGIGTVTEISLDAWHETINTNLNAVFYLLKVGIPELLKRGKGAIVVNGSIAAWKEFPHHPAYCATKGALVSLVKQVALDYAPSVRINILCPGPVDTPLLWNSTKAFPEPETVIREVVDKTVRLKRLGTPEDIAKAALFLVSEDSDWITGASLVIDGGRMLG